MTAEPYVTADDVAEHLKITRRQVLEMTRRGIIPAYPLGVGECRRVCKAFQTLRRTSKRQAAS